MLNLETYLPQVVIITFMVVTNTVFRRLSRQRLPLVLADGFFMSLNLLLAAFWQYSANQLGLILPQLYYIPIVIGTLVLHRLAGGIVSAVAGGIYLALENLSIFPSISGIWLQLTNVTSFVLVAVTGLVIGTEFRHKVSELIRLKEDMEARSITDGLTGLYNYRYFHQRFREEVERARRYGHSLSLVLMDIDHFKKFNDQYGHLVGDAMLQAVAASLRRTIREGDILARYGGEEFVLIFLETDKEGARLVAARLQSVVRETWVEDNGRELGVTFSMGIASFPDDAKDEKGLFVCADMAMYQAKLSRNTVCTFGI